MPEAENAFSPEYAYRLATRRWPSHVEMVLAVADLTATQAFETALSALNLAKEDQDERRNGIMLAAACCDRILGMGDGDSLYETPDLDADRGPA